MQTLSEQGGVKSKTLSSLVKMQSFEVTLPENRQYYILTLT